MRLINTTTLQFEEFSDVDNAPPYAILSHTWNDNQEVTYQDYERTLHRKNPVDGIGYSKIYAAADLARIDHFHYIWYYSLGVFCFVCRSENASCGMISNIMSSFDHQVLGDSVNRGTFNADTSHS